MTELAVLVPVLNRPQNVAPLVESFLAGCPGGPRLVFVDEVAPGDEFDAVEPFLSEHVGWVAHGKAHTWPQKINYGVKVVDADWYLCAADDVRFTEGWWDVTSEARNTPGIGVVGTNDSASGGGNPRVAAGEHTCHPLISSVYIRDYGTVDEPGKAVHGGYRHSFVDDELVLTAKSRNAWAFCQEAVIEHLHPWWVGSEWDQTYEKGQSTFEADKAIFVERVKLLGLQAV